MSVVIGTNTAAAVAANNLAASNLQLQHSLNRLSSGSKIVDPSDDAGGLGVALKLNAAVTRQGAVQNGIGDAVSYAQTQDGALAVAGSILGRVSELETLYQDPTKNTSDKANYDAEFTQLTAQLSALGSQTFNGIALFGSGSLSVATTDDLGASGDVSVVQQGLFTGVSNPAFATLTDSFANLSNWSDHSIGSGSPSISDPVNSYLSLNTTGNDFAVAKSNQSFSGAFDLTVTAQDASGSGAFHVEFGTTLLYNGSFGGMGSPTTIRVVADGQGNATIYKNGTQVGTQSGADTSGQVSLLNQDIGGSAIHVTSFSMRSTATSPSNVASITGASSLSTLSIGTVTGAIQNVATMRAQNGAEQSRLSFASQLLTTNQTNLQSAVSRISDVDVAEETTRLAKWNVLVQAGSSMLSQANQSAQVALRLITG